MYSISSISKITGVSPHTLRYYEKEEILFPKRDKNGIRVYSELDLMWIKFVIKLRNSQMPVKQIKEYTRLFIIGDETKHQRLKLLSDHKSKIIKQIEELNTVDMELTEKIKFYKESILNE